MSEFINTMTSIEKGYFYIALAGTVFFFLQSIFTFIDLGENFNSDVDMDTEYSFFGLSLPFNMFSVRGIIGFLMVFGWTGLFVSKQGDSNAWITFLTAFGAGFATMIIIGLIYYSAFKLSDSGNVDINSAVGKDCEVYLTVPEQRQGMGKVHIVLNGSLKEYDAVTLGDRIDSGNHARVVSIINDKLVIEKIESERV